jgi:cytosine/creatinine deaminase
MDEDIFRYLSAEFEKRKAEKPRHIVEAHRFCKRHKAQVLASKQCGCFYCLQLFSPSEIEIWLGEGEGTAMCPRCGIDAVLPERPGVELTAELLEEMHHYWFGPPKYIRIAIKEAVEQAKKGLAEGGIPIGAVVLRGEEIIGRGHNRRLQNKDITAHGEIEAFRDAGEALFDPAGTTLITTLSPCRMCAGATQIAGIGHVIILDQKNYDDGQAEVLAKAGIKVDVVPHMAMIAIFRDWKDDPANKEIWYGDGATDKVLDAGRMSK